MNSSERIQRHKKELYSNEDHSTNPGTESSSSESVAPRSNHKMVDDDITQKSGLRRRGPSSSSHEIPGHFPQSLHDGSANYSGRTSSKEFVRKESKSSASGSDQRRENPEYFQRESHKNQMERSSRRSEVKVNGQSRSRRNSAAAARAPEEPFATIPPLVAVSMGVFFLIIGILGAFLHMLMNHLYLLFLMMGIAFVLYAATMHVKKYGLLKILPKSAQNGLNDILEGSLFDFLYYSSVTTELFRKWSRIGLLLGDLSTSEIDVVSDGLSPKFLEQVLVTRIKDTLPKSIQNFLDPTQVQQRNRRTPFGPIYEETNPLMRNHAAVVHVLCEKKMIKESQILNVPSLKPATTFIAQNRIFAPLKQAGKLVHQAAILSASFLSVSCLIPSALQIVQHKHSMKSLWEAIKESTLIKFSVIGSFSFGLAAFHLRRKYNMSEDIKQE